MESSIIKFLGEFFVSHPSILTTSKKIDGFKKLQSGWHYGSGIAPSDEVIKKAQSINLVAVFSGMKTDAFPGIDGEIQVTCYPDGEYWAFTIEIDGSINFYRENKFGEEVEGLELSFNEAIKKIRGQSQACVSSYSSIRIILIQPSDDLTTWHSSHQEMEAEYRLFQPIAFQKKNPACVLM